MAFSWKNTIKDAEAMKIRIAKQKARKADPETKLKHPDEVRDANQGKYTVLTQRVKDEYKKYNEMVIGRRNKIAGK